MYKLPSIKEVIDSKLVRTYNFSLFLNDKELRDFFDIRCYHAVIEEVKKKVVLVFRVTENTDYQKNLELLKEVDRVSILTYDSDHSQGIKYTLSDLTLKRCIRHFSCKDKLVLIFYQISQEILCASVQILEGKYTCWKI